MCFELFLTLHRVFHSIRFKVNKDWDRALSLFYFKCSSCEDVL